MTNQRNNSSDLTFTEQHTLWGIRQQWQSADGCVAYIKYVPYDTTDTQEWQPNPATGQRLRRWRSKAALWLAMYLVTLTLFWLETGDVMKGISWGFVAASIKSCVAMGHRCVFPDV